jgi:hypothetical protein
MTKKSANITQGISMTSSPPTRNKQLDNFIDGASRSVARVIADLQQKAEHNEELRAAEHRSVLAEVRVSILEQKSAFEQLQAEVREKLASLRDGVDGKDGTDGRDGRDGKDADMETLLQHIEAKVAQIPVPLDGKDGRDGIDGKDGIDGRDGKDADMEKLLQHIEAKVAEIPVPVDGKDGRDGIDGRDGVDGKDGRDGVDGKDADMEALKQFALTYIQERVSEIPVPKDGVDGRDGRDGTDGKDGQDGVDGKDADMEALKQFALEYIQERVAEIPVPKDGIDGKDGRDGVDGKDAYPGMARGKYDPEAEYRALDTVSFNGSEWRAKVDNPGPLPGDDWMVSAKRGSRGERGDKGEDGRRGQDGLSVVAGYVDKDYQLVQTLSNGEEIKIDLYDVVRTLKGN